MKLSMNYGRQPKMKIKMFNSKIKLSLFEVFNKSLLEKKEAEILASFLLNKTREHILGHPEIEISPSLYNKFKVLEKKRLKNYPIAYLIGEKEFYGLNFKVNKDVLVPRPETEMMVDKIIDILKQEKNNKQTTRPLIIDIGTGSGAIIVSIASELKKLWPDNFKNIEFKALDISADALKIARNNARLHNLKAIKFYKGDLLNPVAKSLTDRNLIIAANLPYLTPSQVKGSPSISREPELALVAGNDGLKYYRELFKQLENIKYKSLTLFCEIDPSQSDSITSLAKTYFPTAKLEIIKDLANLDRFLKIIN